MLNWPARSPLSNSRRLTGGTLRSWSRSAISIWRSLRRATLATLANRLTRWPLASASVSAHLNDLTTHSGDTSNASRDYRQSPARIAHTRTTVGRSSSSRLSRWADVTARPARPRPPPRPRQRDARTDRHRAREQVEQDVPAGRRRGWAETPGCTRRAAVARTASRGSAGTASVHSQRRRSRSEEKRAMAGILVGRDAGKARMGSGRRLRPLGRSRAPLHV